MVGSKSFSSGARISVIPCLAVQSIAAPFLGFQLNSCWNGRQTEVDSATMVVKTLHFTSLAVSLLATRVLSVALPYSGHCSLFTTTFSTSSYPYCRLVYCTTDTTVSSYTVRTPPTAFLLSLSPFLMAATLYLLLVLSAGALYHRYYCTFFHREHSEHGISTVTVSTFSDGWSTSTQSLFHHPSIR